MTIFRPVGARLGLALCLWSHCTVRNVSRSAFLLQKSALFENDQLSVKMGQSDTLKPHIKESSQVSAALANEYEALMSNDHSSGENESATGSKDSILTPHFSNADNSVYKSEDSQAEAISALEPSQNSQEPRLINDLVSLGLISPEIVNGLLKADFHTLTPVQQKVIPRLLKDPKGILVKASTGTGKTLAFGIPAINHSFNSVRARGKVRTLIITPTRDLALQIKKDLDLVISKIGSLSVRRHLVVGTMIGGTKRDRLDGGHVPSIIVATPGRLRANLENRSFADAFAELQFRVYDEADRLLEIGFEEEMLEIHDILTEVQEHSEHKFKSLLFSATVGKRVVNFADLVIDEYEYIDMVPKDAASLQTIDQTIYQTESITDSVKGALEYIYENVISQKDKKAVLFMPTIAAVNLMTEILQQLVHESVSNKANPGSKKFRVNALHSGKSQAFRDKAVAHFHKNANTLLIATDVAARGLHFKDVTHVVQCFPSSQAEDYVHKIGRTGRAGASGIAVSFLRRADKEYMKALQRQHKMDFKVEKFVPNEELAELIKTAAESVDPSDVGSACSSLDGFFLQIERKYRMNKRQTSRDMQDLYAFLSGKTSRVSNLSRRYENLARGGSIRGKYASDEMDMVKDFEGEGSDFFNEPSRSRNYERNSMDDFDEYEPRYTPKRSFSNNKKKYGSNYDRDSGRSVRKNSYALLSKYGNSRPKYSNGGYRGGNDSDDW